MDVYAFALASLFFVFGGIFSSRMAGKLFVTWPLRILASFGLWLLYLQIAVLLPGFFGWGINNNVALISGIFLAGLSWLPWPTHNNNTSIDLSGFSVASILCLLFAWFLTAEGHLSSLFYPAAEIGFHKDVSGYHLPNAIALMREGFWQSTYTNFSSYFFGYELTTIPFIYFSGSVAALFFFDIFLLIIFLLSLELLRSYFLGSFKPSLGNLVFFLVFIFLAYGIKPELHLGKNDFSNGVLLFTAIVFLAIGFDSKKPISDRLNFLVCAALFSALAGTIKPPALMLGGLLVSAFIFRSFSISYRQNGISWRHAYQHALCFGPFLLPALWLVRMLLIGGEPIKSTTTGIHSATFIARYLDHDFPDFISYMMKVAADSKHAVLYIISGPIIWLFLLTTKLRSNFTLHVLGGLSFIGFAIALITPYSALYLPPEPIWSIKQRLFFPQALIALALFIMAISYFSRPLPKQASKPVSPSFLLPLFFWGLPLIYIMGCAMWASRMDRLSLGLIWGRPTEISAVIQSLPPSRIYMTMSFQRGAFHRDSSKPGAFFLFNDKDNLESANLQRQMVEALFSSTQIENPEIYERLGVWVNFFGKNVKHQVFLGSSFGYHPQEAFDPSGRKLPGGIASSKPHYILVVDPAFEGVSSPWTPVLEKQSWARLIYSEPKLYLFEINEGAPWSLIR